MLTKPINHLLVLVIGSFLASVSITANAQGKRGMVSSCSFQGPGGSGSCSIDVTCSEGIPWIHEQRSVIWQNNPDEFPQDTSAAWTATFVNNIHEDGTNYILTAQHVDGIVTAPNPDYEATRWLRLGFRFTTCSGKIIDEYDVIQATWVNCASGDGDLDHDFSLNQVISPIPSDVDIYYSGWSAEENLNPTSGAVIGHPCADCQKIILTNNILPIGNRWKLMYESGNIQVGSSGSPGYDEDHQAFAVMTTGGGCATGTPLSVRGTSLTHNWTFHPDPFPTTRFSLEHQLGRGTTARSVLPIAGYDFDVQDLTFSDPSTDYGRGYFRTMGDINVENVTVESGGDLELHARGTIYIDGPFTAEVGSTLKADVVAPAVGSPPPTCYDPAAPRLPGSQVAQSAQTMQQIEQEIPTIPTLEGNYPNPFAQETRFRLALPTSEHVKITILDILGREVATIMNEDLPAGIANIIWYGRDVAGNPVASGTYFYRIEAGNFVETGSVTVVR